MLWSKESCQNYRKHLGCHTARGGLCSQVAFEVFHDGMWADEGDNVCQKFRCQYTGQPLVPDINFSQQRLNSLIQQRFLPRPFNW